MRRQRYVPKRIYDTIISTLPSGKANKTTTSAREMLGITPEMMAELQAEVEQDKQDAE